MGIYFRYTAAFLTLCLLSLDASATVRVNAKSKAKDIISKPLESGFSLPNGAEAYYGRDKMFEIDNRLNASAGSSIGPTVRPVPASTVGNVSFPYGPNAAYPNGSGVSNPVLKVREKVKVPKVNVKNALKTGLKANVPQLLVGGAIAGLLVGIDAIQEGSTIKFKTDSPVTQVGTGDIHWTFSAGTGGARFATPDAACALYDGTPWGTSGTNILVSITRTSDSSQTCVTRNRYANGTITSVTNVPVYKHGTTCPEGATYNPNKYACTLPSGYASGSDSDFDKIDGFVDSQTAEFISGLITEICAISPSPDRCFADMKEGGGFDISGPTSVQGPSTTKTTTSQNPDGSTSTRTDTSSTNYGVTYNNNNNTFDIDTKITNTTTVDGQVTETSEQTDDTPALDPPPEEETPEETYTFDDTDFPTVEPFYEVKYPDGLQGVWQSISAQIDNSAFIQFLQGFVPNFSGSCPAFGLNLNIASWANYGNRSFDSICYVLDFVKIILLVTALFTFRKVTFGG